MSISITPCQYLFNRDTGALFPKQDPKFIDKSLETMMQIVDHLVQKNPEALCLFDPTAGNNQCHLYSLFVAQSIPQAKIESAVASELPMDGAVGQVFRDYMGFVDRRFLYHSFFLSAAFLTDSTLLVKVAAKTQKAMGLAALSKEFTAFLKDSQGHRLRASRSALNELFEKHMKMMLSSGEGALSSELSAIAASNLKFPSDKGEDPLYTFPKFAGVAYLIEVLAHEKIPLLFKVKVADESGVNSFGYSNQNLKALEPETPVIVFEMVATGDSLSSVRLREIAKSCPRHSQRNISSKNRHSPKEVCISCSPKKLDVAPFQKKYQPVFEKSNEMLLALGADFVRESQKPFLGFFSDTVKFPKLTALFDASVPHIEHSSLSMTKPQNMTVSHVYPDSAAKALSEGLIINDSYEVHLEKRGLL